MSRTHSPTLLFHVPNQSTHPQVAEQMEVQRIGPQHQAGSDSLLTSLTFLKLARKFFSGVEGASKHMGILYGLGVDGNNEFRNVE